MKQIYDTIIPFGYRCFGSMHLRACRLQFESYPFDWIMFGKLETLVQILEQDFSHFLHKENLERTDCDLIFEFIDKSNGLSFMHDFDSADLTQAYPPVRQRYERRIARFRERLAEGKRVLLFHYGYEDISDQTLNQLYLRIKNCFPGKSVDLAYVYEDKTDGYQYNIISPGLVKCHIKNTLGWEKVSPDCRRFFKTIGLDLKTRLHSFFPDLIYRYQRFLFSPAVVRLRCCFTLDRCRRRQLREIARSGTMFRQ